MNLRLASLFLVALNTIETCSAYSFAEDVKASVPTKTVRRLEVEGVHCECEGTELVCMEEGDHNMTDTSVAEAREGEHHEEDCICTEDGELVCEDHHDDEEHHHGEEQCHCDGDAIHCEDEALEAACHCHGSDVHCDDDEDDMEPDGDGAFGATASLAAVAGVMAVALL
ncbi:hypothetical protein IV203_008295 [Nitzschia inconspicua]|uniref:Uncharacterized protein n=1 Tax=Nitzschia inconspicua TaxID=303405 RepID=A0A9K3KYL8_9STRA|nr:hypothetical protein IV203_008295 [Nitzschia inconspicua]